MERLKELSIKYDRLKKCVAFTYLDSLEFDSMNIALGTYPLDGLRYNKSKVRNEAVNRRKCLKDIFLYSFILRQSAEFFNFRFFNLKTN